MEKAPFFGGKKYIYASKHVMFSCALPIFSPIKQPIYDFSVVHSTNVQY